MKLKLLFAIVLIMCGVQVNAQRKRISNYNFSVDQTSLLFPRPDFNVYGRHRVRIVAKNKTVIDMRLQSMSQLQSLKNLDSILTRVWTDVEALKDSFPNDLNNRRLDVNFAPEGNTKIRITTHPPRGSSFVKTTEGLSLLKIEQDTLYITGTSGEKQSQAIVMNPDMGRPSRAKADSFRVYVPWTICILINYLSEIPSITGTLNQHTNTVAADYQSLFPYKKPNGYMNNVNLLYEPYSNYSGKDKYIVYKPYKQRYFFAMLVQAGIQNVRSDFAASAGLGVGFSNIVMARPGNAFYLVWEPFFFFDKNSAGKTVIQRNDFITFQFKERFGRLSKDADINLANNFSLGYLLHRDGDHFNKNTFKLGLPGLEFRNLQLQPQFIFNNLFKQFYPGVKLQVQID